MHVSFAERGCAGCTFPSALRWALSLAQVDAAVEQSQSSIRSGWPEQLHYYPAFHFLALVVFFSIFVKSSFDDVNIHLWCVFLAPQILISFYLFFLFTLLNQAFVSRFLFQLNFDTKSVQENGMKWVAPASSSCQLGPKAFDLCACSTADCCDSDQRKTRLNSLGMGGKRETMASVTQCHLPRYMQVVLNSVHCKICFFEFSALQFFVLNSTLRKSTLLFSFFCVFFYDDDVSVAGKMVGEPFMSRAMAFLFLKFCVLF